MNKTGIIKRQHEIAVLQDFLTFWNALHSKTFQVVERPEPPDAIVQSGSEKLWLEHADVYRSAEEAKSRSVLSSSLSCFWRYIK